jgi:hypothetical protein
MNPSPPCPRPPVRRRIVFHLGGYDFVPPTEQHRIFARELDRFARNWHLRVETDPAPSDGELIGAWHASAAGPNWQCSTSYRVWRWDDLVREELARGHLRRLGRAAATLVDFVATGTVGRYFRRFWPVTVFFGFAYGVLALFGLVAGAAAVAVGGSLGIGVGATVFGALYLATARRWRLAQALDLWSFGYDYVRPGRAPLDRRLESFAASLLAASEEPAVDEIVIVGHSWGSTLALEVLTRALARRPDLGRTGTPVRLLTVGSLVAQMGLHPRGAAVRAAAATVASSGVDWAEYHACDDALNFYKVDPVSLEVRRDYPPGSRPMVRRVHVRDMLAPATYHRFRRRWIRLHYQFLMANDVRAPYDFFMFACGPLSFPAIVAAPRGPADFIDADGGWIGAPGSASSP